MDLQQKKKYIIQTIVARFASQNADREASLKDLLQVTLPQVEDAALDGIAAMVPQLPDSLYEKWATMFAERLLETVSLDILDSMCADTEEGQATLSLVFVMFMESERMEKQIAEDLAVTNTVACADDASTLLGAWLKHKMTTH